MQNIDAANGPMCGQFVDVSECCANTLMCGPSTDQLHCCSHCHSPGVATDADRHVTTVVTDADDVTSPASASQNDTSSPRHVSVQTAVLLPVISDIKLIKLTAQAEQLQDRGVIALLSSL